MAVVPPPSPPSPFAPADNPAVIAHMNMLQAIITRLANNSASCKTWCLALVGALVSLAGAAKVGAIIHVAIVPILIFGFLDTMYLAQEKAYRDLFNATADRIRAGTYTMANVYKAGAARKWADVGAALVSWSVWPVYGGLIALYLVALCKGWLALLTKP